MVLQIMTVAVTVDLAGRCQPGPGEESPPHARREPSIKSYHDNLMIKSIKMVTIKIYNGHGQELFAFLAFT
jgi:hypothetical protein